MAKRPDASVPGIVVVDKPAGLTSHDVVSRMRRLAHTRKVGHGGTLDPMATGVLVVGVGKATRLLTHVTGHSKTYEATIRFGATTTTDDAEGGLVETRGCPGLDATRLSVEMAKLRGEIDQVPSSVSAKKIDGRRAYALVREGREVELAANRVTVFRFEALSAPRPAHLLIDEDGARAGSGENARVEAGIDVVDLDVVVDCSSGTYIRALARDLGAALGVGAHLTRLRRTRVGGFSLGDCRTLASLEDEAAARESDAGEGRAPEPGQAPPPAPGLIPLDEAVRAMFPVLDLDPEEAGRFLHGNSPARERAEVLALLASGPAGADGGAGASQALRTDSDRESGAGGESGSGSSRSEANNRAPSSSIDVQDALAGPRGPASRDAAPILAAAAPDGRILGLIDASRKRLTTVCVFFGGE